MSGQTPRVDVSDTASGPPSSDDEEDEATVKDMLEAKGIHANDPRVLAWLDAIQENISSEGAPPPKRREGLHCDIDGTAEALATGLALSEHKRFWPLVRKMASSRLDVSRMLELKENPVKFLKSLERLKTETRQALKQPAPIRTELAQAGSLTPNAESFGKGSAGNILSTTTEGR